MHDGILFSVTAQMRLRGVNAETMAQISAFLRSNFKRTFLGRQKELEAQKKTGIASRLKRSFSRSFIILVGLVWVLDNRLDWMCRLTRIFGKYWIFIFFAN